MKIGSDAVLLASLLEINPNSKRVMEVGSGTGVISLMLAQRYPQLIFDLIEIDSHSAKICTQNVMDSPWSSNFQVFNTDFLNLNSDKSYHHIISNPPYFLNALKSENIQKVQSKHIERKEFEKWLYKMMGLTTVDGVVSMILPLEAFEYANQTFNSKQFFLINKINISSFKNSEVIRVIASWSKFNSKSKVEDFYIYEAEKEYSKQYIQALKDYLIIF